MKRRTAVSIVVAAVVALMAVAPSMAGKGGNKGNNSAGSTSSAWVSATPNPASVGDRIYLSGCGFPFQVGSVSVSQPDGSTQSFLVGMWANGCTDTASFFANQAGTYTVRITAGGVSASTSVRVG